MFKNMKQVEQKYKKIKGKNVKFNVNAFFNEVRTVKGLPLLKEDDKESNKKVEVKK